MTSPSARTIGRRDAAVTAALCGTVLVVLGYASGIGLERPTEVAASLPAPTTAAPEAPVTTTPDLPSAVPVPALAPAPIIVSAVPAPATETPHEHTTTPSASPTPTPAPSAPAATCPPGLVPSLFGSLPVLSGVTTLVTNLLTTPLLGASSMGGPAPTTGLGCTVGALLGTTCCDQATAARSATGSR